MLLEARMLANNKLEVEYDEEAQNALVQAGIFSGLWKAVDADKIGQLEQEVLRLKKRNRKLRERLRNAK